MGFDLVKMVDDLFELGFRCVYGCEVLLCEIIENVWMLLFQCQCCLYVDYYYDDVVGGEDEEVDWDEVL